MSINAGDKAPVFNTKNQEGKLISLDALKGNKVVLYFYPKDDTPGCTKEACSLRDGHAELKKRGFVVLGVSADNESKHQKFIDKYNLPFDLLADTDREIIQAYGAWGMKKFMGKEYEGIIRKTFIIDESGVVEHVIDNVKTADHANQILEIYA